jgi:hypothetical protein
VRRFLKKGMPIVRCGKQGLAVNPTQREHPGKNPRQQKEETTKSIRKIERMVPSVHT